MNPVNSILCVSVFFVILSLLLGAVYSLRQTLKMQNKPKLKFAQIPLIPYMQRIYKNTLQPPQQKNKAKQTQTAHVTPPSASRPGKASSRQLRSSSVSIRRDPLQNKKMTNEPNCRTSKNALTPSLLRTKNCELRSASAKNEPKRTQTFGYPAILPKRILSIESSKKNDKQTKSCKHDWPACYLSSGRCIRAPVRQIQQADGEYFFNGLDDVASQVEPLTAGVKNDTVGSGDGKIGFH
jgi:hypothetical protein